MLNAAPTIARQPAGRRALVAVLLAALAWASATPQPGQADEPVFSGPQPGERLPAFTLQGVYDERAGESFDPVEQAGQRPTLLVFVHHLTRPGFALTRGLTRYAQSIAPDKAYAAVVWLTDDKADAERYLNRARRSLNLNVPVGISLDGPEGPGAYGLNRNVELTILVAKDQQVIANAALVQPSLSDGLELAGALAKSLGKEPPSIEAFEAIAYPKAKMRKMRRGKPGARAGRAGDRKSRPAGGASATDTAGSR